MTTKTRITKLEQAQQTNDGGRIVIYREGAEMVKVDGVEMTRAEWDKIRTERDFEIVIRYASKAIKDGVQ
jgi:hypothetical protein